MKALLLLCCFQWAFAEEAILPLAPRKMDGFNGSVQFPFSAPVRAARRDVSSLALNRSTPKKATTVVQRESSRSKR